MIIYKLHLDRIEMLDSSNSCTISSDYSDVDLMDILVNLSSHLLLHSCRTDSNSRIRYRNYYKTILTIQDMFYRREISGNVVVELVGRILSLLPRQDYKDFSFVFVKD